MYNSNIPNTEDLPSSKQLVIATIGAGALALVLLFVCILPAEYAIDPIGLGEKFGLLTMGEIKVQLEAESHAYEEKSESSTSSEIKVVESQTTPSDTSQPALVETSVVSGIDEAIESSKRDTQQIVLAPGKASEWKLIMKEGAVVKYKWYVDKGHMNFDTHGDNSSIDYHGYNKGRAVQGDEGELKAAFDGSHGWFWRNRYSETVTVTLEVSGEYDSIKKVF